MKRIKRLLTVMICTICLFQLCIPVSAAEVPAVPTSGDVWDGSILKPTTLVQKEGVTYYEITKCAELAYVAQTGGDWLGYNYILGNDLILNDTLLKVDENGELTNTELLLTWTPIGIFTGKFDGGGYTISGSNASIFSELSSAAVLRNLNVVNAHVSSAVDDEPVGGIVGYSKGTISKCTFSGTVKFISTTITVGIFEGVGGIAGCSNEGKIDGCINYGFIIGDTRCGGIVGYASGTIDNCTNYGPVKANVWSAGGIIAYNNSSYTEVSNCTNFSNVSATNGSAGGIVGSAGPFGGQIASDCENYGNITGKNAGGIFGYACTDIQNCHNYGTVKGEETAGGICGESSSDDISRCSNLGNVLSSLIAAGISGRTNYGSYNIQECYNQGDISGTEKCGGIIGESTNEKSGKIENCYNLGKVSGTTNIGGIISIDKYCNITNCYNIGVVSGESNCGMIASTTDYIWGKSAVSHNYYAAGQFSAFGDLADAANIAEAKSAATLQQQSTFVNWDFSSTWKIDPDLNGGYPYLQWQTIDDTPITVNSVTLDQSALSLSTGDSVYLTASLSPTTVTDKTVTWHSDTPTVADVSSAGKVSAIRPGTAVITVTTANGISASCTVTVIARAVDEYQLTSLHITDVNDNKLSAIPTADFWATVSLKKCSDGGNSMILLAAYDKDGRFLSVNFARAANVPVGSTVQLGFMLSNRDGEIAYVKAFCIASLQILYRLRPDCNFPSLDGDSV